MGTDAQPKSPRTNLRFRGNFLIWELTTKLYHLSIKICVIFNFDWNIFILQLPEHG